MKITVTVLSLSVVVAATRISKVAGVGGGETAVDTCGGHLGQSTPCGGVQAGAVLEECDEWLSREKEVSEGAGHG